MSLPIRADVLVNCVPASCIPSPESPQNRTVASSSVRTCLSCLSKTAEDIADDVSSTSVGTLPQCRTEDIGVGTGRPQMTRQACYRNCWKRCAARQRFAPSPLGEGRGDCVPVFPSLL